MGSTSMSQEEGTDHENLISKCLYVGQALSPDILGLVLQYCTYEEMFFERPQPNEAGAVNRHRGSIFRIIKRHNNTGP